MEDDTEILDWGHEEEEGDFVGSEQHSFTADDAEDAVSLGGDEEDEFLTYQSRVPQGATHRGHSPPKNSQQTMVRQEAARSHAEAHRPSQLHQHQEEQQMERANSGTPQKHKNTPNSPASEQSPLLKRTHSHGKLTHALPPKPVVSSVPFVHPSHPSIIEATAMASRAERDKRNGVASKPVTHDTSDPLPPGWEVKYPRSGRGVYYYNIHTQECTWTLPTSAATRVQRSQRSDRREDPIDKPLPSKSDEALISRVGRSDGDMSYDDRHYRPGDDGRREDRLATSTHLITGDTYIPDTYVPGQRNGRSSPAPSRTRDSDLGPPPRRPTSPAGSYGDSIQGSYREVPAVSTLSAEDRTWVARDIVPVERPREHKERDHDSAPSDHEYRSLPRDTDRSSTLRPKSPVSYSRDSQESVTTPHTSSKSAQANFEVPPPKQKSRFSQADVPVQSDHRQSDTHDSGTRQARTDDIAPLSSHHRNDDIPSSRSLSDARGGSDIPKPSASDAQRSESRKRTPLPPQSEAFRPGSRLGTLQRDSGYTSSGLAAPAQASAPPREIRSANRAAPSDGPRDTTRHTPSPTVPQVDLPTAERSDRARSRRSKSSANGPMHMDSYFPPESTRDRDRDVAMDVDDAPPPRSSDPPPRHSLPKRPVTQDEVPRYPRAMLGADGDGTLRGSTTGREARETKEMKQGKDEPSRSGPTRGRQQEERHAPVDSGASQEEPTRLIVEPKAPPAAPNIRLSGTNNIPIGTRNRFSGPPPVPASGDGRRDADVMFGNNAGPVDTNRSGRTGKDYERPPHRDVSGGQQVATNEPGQRVDARTSPSSSLRALPTAEIGGPVGSLGRPPRSTLGIAKGTTKSRFGPPIVKESTEPTHPQRNVSSESLRSEPLPEDASRATPPPLSRESSMTSVRGAAGQSGLPAHLPPRPQSPPRGYRYRAANDSQGQHRDRAQSPAEYSRRRDDVDMEPPPRQRPATPTHKRRTMDSYVPDPLPPARDTYVPEPPRESFQDTRGDHYVPQPAPMTQDEERERAPAMHPERALMLQPNGLPPRPPSILGRARSGKGARREKRDDRERAEGFGGNGVAQFSPASPGGGERRRYPKAEGGTVGQGSGASLLDRLTLDEGVVNASPSLRDRVQLPSKRDREDMLAGDVSMNQEVDEHDGSKRPRRRGTKSRKARR